MKVRRLQDGTRKVELELVMELRIGFRRARGAACAMVRERRGSMTAEEVFLRLTIKKTLL